MNLAEKFEDATSAQPYADRSAAHYIAAGQHARARRRAVLAGGVCTVVLLGVGAATVGLQAVQSNPRQPEIATQSPQPATPSPNAQVFRDMAVSGAHAGYDGQTGELVLDHGWRVDERLSSPWRTGAFGEPTPPTKSVALVVTDGTDTQWILLDWEAGGQQTGAIYDNDPGARGFTSLAAYVAVEMARRQSSSTDELVAYSGPDALKPLNGVTIIAQQPVTLEDGTRAVLAQLKVLHNDWYVVAKRTPDGETYVPVSYPLQSESPGLAGFLAHVNDLVVTGGVE